MTSVEGCGKNTCNMVEAREEPTISDDEPLAVANGTSLLDSEEQPMDAVPPTDAPPQLVANLTLLDNVEIFHELLWGQCMFSTLPELENQQGSGKRAQNPTPFRVFFGQVKREVTPAQMRWIIHRVCGVNPLSVETRTSGCFYAYGKTGADSRAMRDMHKRVLFDSSGIWIARDAEKSDLLNNYVKEHRESFPPHLPKDTIVVEDPRPLKAKKRNSDKANANSNANANVNASANTSAKTPQTPETGALQQGGRPPPPAYEVTGSDAPRPTVQPVPMPMPMQMQMPMPMQMPPNMQDQLNMLPQPPLFFPPPWYAHQGMQ